MATFLADAATTAAPASPSTPVQSERISATLVLHRSTEGREWYRVTPASCSCPSNTFRPEGPCKHMRLHFAAPVVRCRHCGTETVERAGDVCRDCLHMERVIEEQEGARPVRQSPIYRETLDQLIRDADALSYAASFRSPNAPAIY